VERCCHQAKTFLACKKGNEQVRDGSHRKYKRRKEKEKKTNRGAQQSWREESCVYSEALHGQNSASEELENRREG